ncbi:ABC transporter ATP-binding protein [Ancylomarina euxinus]|uniref:ABC transporter ATP-binding protein n=1 Tax=Ancylomarina euxinus TaxID=2283627 RepID=A0A425XYD9_9BACT|nr:ABC transporter ATP-binding protein [Ancylomarina euxinus]MCZ4695808.1 ABC transporter ATP-binding protein [Ancylomarina euxinus]MUP16129.1 ATP-binding cassette domain-containing protein [Ancylomarina euxinus]RRG19849.1 ABC transporter ATP-binding protein [Ancylomarina euxinus]
MITAKQLKKSFGQVHVLKGLDFNVKKGEIVIVVGASGAGKTTLLQILGTLDRPDSGQLFFDGVDISSLNEKDLSAFRNKNIGFVFQFHHLLPEFTALENVCIPAFIAKKSRAEATTKAKELLCMLGLDHRLDHKPSELSGGEKQRVAIARALVNDPMVIFADEPSGNLDSVTRQELHEIIVDLRNKLNQTFVIVTHDLEMEHMADRKIVMTDGMIDISA